MTHFTFNETSKIKWCIELCKEINIFLWIIIQVSLSALMMHQLSIYICYIKKKKAKMFRYITWLILRSGLRYNMIVSLFPLETSDYEKTFAVMKYNLVQFS